MVNYTVYTLWYGYGFTLAGVSNIMICCDKLQFAWSKR